MAKKEETKEVKNVEMTEENVIDQIKAGNKMPSTIAEKVAEQIKKEEEDKKCSELKRCMLKAEYWRKKSLLQLRARRREAKITKDYLKTCEEELNKLAGGEITVLEYDKNLDKAQTDRRKATSESDGQLREECRELKNSLAGDYVWDWD